MLPQHHILLFVIVPMFAGIVAMFLYPWRKLQRLWGILALLANLTVAIMGVLAVFNGYDQPGSILVSQMGNWPAPFGITVVLDGLSALMLLVAAIVVLAVFIYAIHQLPDDVETGLFHPLFHFQLMGVNWAFVTGDLFNLFVSFEIMLLASYALFVLGTSRAQIRQAYKYILLNLLGSTLFVTCAGMLYGHIGTLNMADIARIAYTGQLPPNSIPLIAMLLVVFGGKTAIFPLWFWLPDSYPTLPPALVALFAGLLTKVGAYVMLRVFVMMFGASEAVTNVLLPVVLISAGVTMFVGVLGAVSMHTVRRILAIHIISQVGYMVLGIGLGMGAVASISPETLDSKTLAVAGAIFFILHNMVVKCCLFLCGGLIIAHAGSDDLPHIGGLLKRAPWLAVLFFIASMSLAGLPPLSGFFGKWVLISESFHQHQYTLAGFALATSLLTLLSMLKIWSYGFWSPAQGQHVTEPTHRPNVTGGMVAITMLVVVALSMGLAAQNWLNLCHVAARSIVDPKPYITAVLGHESLALTPSPSGPDHPGLKPSASTIVTSAP